MMNKTELLDLAENVETILPGRLVRRHEHGNTCGMSYAAAIRSLPLPERGGRE